MWRRTLSTLLVLHTVWGFNFTTTRPTQCDDLTVNWSGGKPPFRLIIVPPGDAVRNLSIPSSAYNGETGSFSTQLTYVQNQKLILSMSDATGPLTGGTSDVLIVGPPVSGQNCNTTRATIDFFFSLDSDLVQCRPYPFTQYPNATLPITVLVLLPLGQSFVLYPPPADTFVWTANLTTGTPVSFAVSDSQGRSGGSSSVRTVLGSNNSSCITNSSSGNAPNTTNKHTLKTGAIIGAAIAGTAALAILTALAIWFFKRRDRLAMSQTNGSNPAYEAIPPNTPTQSIPPSQYHAIPFTLSQQSQPVGGEKLRKSQPAPMLQDTTRQSVVSANDPSTASGSWNPHTSRIMVHTDIAETMEPLIELPPQYSERRAPLPGLSTSEEGQRTALPQTLQIPQTSAEGSKQHN
ncbi:hypothetical protein BD779DRAFT_1464899 [Infundibulicybe gibba]|nr:hypothetical protein BD779DRAFT_1464899 [Infundibulicybe gibba]